jgi:fluoroquinolone transport system permease protein
MNSNASTFASILSWDLKTQLRYYFWIAGLFVTLVWILVLKILPMDVVAFWLPVLLFVDTCSIGIMFIAGLLFLDRHQGTIEAIAVMPTATSSWLLSKVLTLSLLCTVCALAIVFFSAESVNWIKTVPAVALSSIFYTSFGFILACPFQKIQNYFLAMSLALAVLSIPVYGYLDLLNTPLLWLLPSQPAMVVLSAASNEVTSTSYSFALLVLLGWSIATFWAATRAFHYFVTDRMEG